MSTEALIALGAQLNVSGICDKYHIIGVTPDARTPEEAFGGRAPKRRIIITEQDLEDALHHYFPPPKRKIDFVMLGCPHYTYAQVKRVAELLGGKKAVGDIWILTSSAVKDLALQTGLEAELASSGGRLVSDTCVDQSSCFGHLSGAGGVTDSPKCAYYMGAFGVDVAVRDVETCIRWAISGRVD